MYYILGDKEIMKDKLKYLIVIDMQKDFIDGSLANPMAEKIVEPICNEILKGDYDKIIFTKDTHYPNYMDTLEGKYLPVPHCIFGTEGHEIDPRLLDAAKQSKKKLLFINKLHFGYDNWGSLIHDDVEEVTLVGTCTDICVISNALAIKALNPVEPKVKVIGSLCAATTEENQEHALSVMKMCQVEVK